MAYTTELRSGFGHIVHNSDYSGTIEIVISNTVGDDARVEIPFADILGIVADWKRNELISRIENEDDDVEIINTW